MPLPFELEIERKETTLVGDIDEFMEYYESGQALKDWYDRIIERTEECETYLREHSHVWRNIIIQL